MELTDDKVWEVTKLLYVSFQQEEQEKKLDVEKLSDFKRENVKPLYPHKVGQDQTISKYTCKESCCEVSPGYFCCCKSTTPDPSFRKLGLGMCLYFKFLKHINVLLIPVTLVALILSLICIWITFQNGFDISDDYNSFLFSTTLGSFAAEKIKCSYSKITEQNNTLYPFRVGTSLNCPYGQVNYFGAVFSNQSQASLYNCRLEIQRIDTNQNLATPFADPSTIFNNCTGNPSLCQVQLDLDSNTYASKTVSFGYECRNQVYRLGFLEAPSRIIFIIIVAVDIFLCLSFLLFYVSQKKAEEAEEDYFKCQQLSLNDFSLKIKGFSMETYEQQLQDLLIWMGHMLGGEAVDGVVQVKTPDRLDFIEYQVRKEAKYKMLYSFMDRQFFSKEVNPTQFKSTSQFTDYCFSKDIIYEAYKKSLYMLVEDYLSEVYRPSGASNESTGVSIYVVFDSLQLKDRMWKLKLGQFSSYIKVQNRRYEISEAPAPDLILWKNKGKNLILRSIVSWFVTLVICFGSYAFFGFLQLEQKQLLADYNFKINCQVLFPNEVWTVLNPTQANADPNYFSCFCTQNLFSFNNPSYDLCSDWRVKYVTYLSIPIVMSLLFVVYNVIVSRIFKLLTTLEAYRLVTDQLLSYTIKRAFLMMMDMGLIIILLNTQYNNNPNWAKETTFSFLVQGKYHDITADWYFNIGSIIILTMLFNISFPLIELGLASTLKGLKLCWDRRCWQRPTSCRTKKQFIQLYEDDLYPIEERYAFLIATIIVTFAFSCVIPLLLIVCAIAVLFLYLTDKLLVFKLYQTPLNYSHHLHSLVRRALYFGLIVHMALSAVFLSQPQLIAADSQTPESSQLITGNARIDAMLNTVYIIPYLIILSLLIIWGIFDNTIVKFISKLIPSCRNKNSEQEEQRSSQDYFSLLSTYQLHKLIRITENQLDKMILKNQTQPGFYEMEMVDMQNFGQIEDTKRQLAPLPPRVQIREIILRNTMDKLADQLNRRGREKQDLTLFGAPGYQIMMNDQAFDVNKKNILLSEDLQVCLEGFIENDSSDSKDSISNDDL